MFNKKFWQSAKDSFFFTWEYRYMYNAPCNREYDQFAEHDALQLATIAVFDFLGMFVRAAVCEVLGHKLIGGGWATPDTGGESVSCTRCGYSWSHTYY